MSAPADAAARRTRVRIGLGSALVLLFVALGCAVLFSALAKGHTETVTGGQAPGASSPGGAEPAVPGEAGPGGTSPGGASTGEPGTDGAGAGGTGAGGEVAGSPGSDAPIFVHILGAVNRPGLYELRDGDRGVDAVAAAGGFTPAADQAQLNLARFLADGEQILVPAVGEAAAPPGVPQGGGAVVPGKVNINTADAAALETLPRVGPAMAARIIAWRTENGRFTAVEDLLSISGIGERTFDGLKQLVTV